MKRIEGRAAAKGPSVMPEEGGDLLADRTPAPTSQARLPNLGAGFPSASETTGIPFR